MTSVRRRAGMVQSFISQRRIGPATHARLIEASPREGPGRDRPPQGLVTSSFSRPRLNGSALCVAAALSLVAGGTGHRASSSVTSAMITTIYTARTDDFRGARDTPTAVLDQDSLPAERAPIGETTDEQSGKDVQSGLSLEDRFDAFDTLFLQPSNEKSMDGAGELTDLTDLTPNRTGVYVAGTRTRPLSGAPGLYTSLRFRNRQIRQTRQTARRQRAKIGGFHPPGVKSVKSNPVSDSEVTG